MTKKICFFDVENSPDLVWVYDHYRENNVVAVETPWWMLSFAWKNLGDKRIRCKALPDYKGYDADRTNDRLLVSDLHKVFDDNDILIGHNIQRFDVRKANARFLHWGLKPPSPFRIVDTLKIIRNIAYLNRNNLDMVAKFLGHEGKFVTTGWELHRACIGGHRPSWKIMKHYNKVDVDQAEKSWRNLAPWVKNHPPITDTGCPSCGSQNVNRRGPVRKSRTKFQFVCLDCGHWYTATL